VAKQGFVMKLSAFVVLFFWLTSCSLNAQIPDVNNGGFEEDPNFPLHWEVTGYIPPIDEIPTIVEQYIFPDRHVYKDIILDPCEGQQFLVIQSGGGAADTNYTELRQTIIVRPGDTISGVYFFGTSDYMPYNDRCVIGLADPCFPFLHPDRIEKWEMQTIMAFEDVNGVGDRSSTLGWKPFSHTFTDSEAGDRLLVLLVEDAIDYLYPSFLAVDALHIVPGPACRFLISGDLNDDCKVDFLDIDRMAGEWLNVCDTSTWCNNCDIYRVESPGIGYTVDFSDFRVLAANWLIDCNALPRSPRCILK
jgi:hypothetical protein